MKLSKIVQCKGIARKAFGGGWIWGEFAFNLVAFYCSLRFLNSKKFNLGFEPINPLRLNTRMVQCYTMKYFVYKDITIKQLTQAGKDNLLP